MRLSTQGAYSVTLLKHSKQICKKILDELKIIVNKDLSISDLKNFKITDGTAGNGGDSITFCRIFKHVNSVEKDQLEFNFLRHNVNRLGLQNITLICDTVLNQLDLLDQDVLYLDPPWGGKNYKSQDTVDLFLDNVPLAWIVAKCFRLELTVLIAIKIPENFNLAGFTYDLNELFKCTIKNHYIDKYNLLLIHR